MIPNWGAVFLDKFWVVYRQAVGKQHKVFCLTSDLLDELMESSRIHWLLWYTPVHKPYVSGNCGDGVCSALLVQLGLSHKDFSLLCRVRLRLKRIPFGGTCRRQMEVDSKSNSVASTPCEPSVLLSWATDLSMPLTLVVWSSTSLWLSQTESGELLKESAPSYVLPSSSNY